MSAEIQQVATDVLTPLVGHAMATLYVSKATHEIGKTADTIERQDVPAMLEEIRKAMAPFTSRELLDRAVYEIVHRVG